MVEVILALKDILLRQLTGFDGVGGLELALRYNFRYVLLASPDHIRPGRCDIW